MTEEENTNEKSSSQQAKAEPIKRKRDIKAIKTLLTDNPRNSTLFILGINTNMMPNELIHLKVKQVKHLKENEPLEIKDEKTGKVKKITLNRTCVTAIQSLLASAEFADDDNLFKSQRGSLIVPSLHRLVNKWCEAINLKGNFGSHTLRKTWGYHQHHSFGIEVSQLKNSFGHSTRKQTKDYLGLDDESEKNLFLHEL